MRGFGFAYTIYHGLVMITEVRAHGGYVAAIVRAISARVTVELTANKYHVAQARANGSAHTHEISEL